MSKPAFEKTENLFHEALALPTCRRGAFLDFACNGDKELRAAVEALLRNAAAESKTDKFLVSPVADAAARLRSEAPTLRSKLPDAPENFGLTSTAIPGFEILEELGRGGMGVVYKVRQTNLGRIVALKMLLPSDLAGPEMLARFRTEVETLARLKHPNIITIYDIGEFDRRPYFTMEFVDGPGLDHLLTGKPQDAAASARLIEIVARTIHAVHQQGIIHRDLKPANVLLQESGDRSQETGEKAANRPGRLPPDSLVPKITDFGLAKNQADGGKLTQTGITMGTPAYMAPEQAHALGVGVGPATDIYALGSILYEMLAGRPPFVGDSAAEVINQLLHDEPLSPARLRPSLPRDLVTICVKCLEKSPGQRYASALDLAEDLRRFQAGEPIRARPVGWLGRTWRWCRRRPLVAGLGFLCALLIVALVSTVLVYDSQLKAALAKAKGKVENQRQQMVQLNITIGTGAAEKGDTAAALFNFIEALRLDEGFAGAEDWKHRTRIGTALRQTKNGQTGNAPLPAEKTVVVEGVRSVKLANGLTVEVNRAANAAHLHPLPMGEKVVTAAAFSPDGRFLVIREEDNSIRVWNTATGRPLTPRLPARTAVVFAAFSPDGKLLVTTSDDHVARVWDPYTGLPLAPPMTHALVCRRAYFSADDNKLVILQDEDISTIWDLRPDMRPVEDLLKLVQDLDNKPNW